MAAQSDGEYALTLMTLLRADCDRLGADHAWSPIVIWEAEELIRQSSDLDIPRELGSRLRDLADEALVLVRRVRDAERGVAA